MEKAKGTKRTAPDGGTWGRWHYRQKVAALGEVEARRAEADRKILERALETPEEKAARYQKNREYQRERREAERPERERKKAEKRAARELEMASPEGVWRAALARAIFNSSQRTNANTRDEWTKKMHTLYTSSLQRPAPTRGEQRGVRKHKATWAEAVKALCQVGRSKLCAVTRRKDPWVDCMIRKVECFKSRGRRIAWKKTRSRPSA